MSRRRRPDAAPRGALVHGGMVCGLALLSGLGVAVPLAPSRAETAPTPSRAETAPTPSRAETAPTPSRAGTAPTVAESVMPAAGVPVNVTDLVAREPVLGDLLRDLGARLVPPVPASERERLQPVEAAVAGEAGAGEGSFATLRDRTPLRVSLADAAWLALRNNLALAVAGLEPARAAAAIAEARALFDPELQLAVNFNRTDASPRYKVGWVYNKPFNSGQDEAQRRIEITPGSASPAVIAIVFARQDEGLVREPVAAKAANQYGPKKVGTVTASLTQQLPWGPSLTLSSVTRQQKIFYSHGHSWDRGQFSSDVAVSLTSPLPGAKGFGPDAIADAAGRLAAVDAERADWDVREAVNATLLEVELGWWGLVRRLQDLGAVLGSRDTVRTTRDRVRRHYDLRLATEYEMAQADAELAKAGIEVEDARRAYVDASTALGAVVLDAPEAMAATVFLPVGWDEALAETHWLRASAEAARATALAERPLLKAAAVTTRRAEMTEAVADNLARPDVSVRLDARLSQDGSTYGYADPLDSFKHIGRPDTTRVAGRLALTRPWGNRAAEANRTVAALSTADSRLVAGQKAAAVDQTIEETIAGLASARQRARLATREEGEAARVVAGLARRQEAGEVGQYEVITATRTLLAARRARIAAGIDNRILEARLLAAQGGLAASLAERAAAVSSFEGYRLGRLAAAGGLRYFRSTRGDTK